MTRADRLALDSALRRWRAIMAGLGYLGSEEAFRECHERHSRIVWRTQ